MMHLLADLAVRCVCAARADPPCPPAPVPATTAPATVVGAATSRERSPPERPLLSPPAGWMEPHHGALLALLAELAWRRAQAITHEEADDAHRDDPA